MIRFLIIYFFILLYASCSPSLHQPQQKYPPSQLVSDYDLMVKVLKKTHPSLYWYTPKDSMEFYINSYRSRIKDSMKEQEFMWHVIAPMINKIRCGHTSVNVSKSYEKRLKNIKSLPSFPLYLKVWNDTMMVTANLNAQDTLFKRGTIIQSINGISKTQIIQEILDRLPEDGYAHNVNYIRMSSRFPAYHRAVFGLSKSYHIEYMDSSGQLRQTTIPVFDPLAKDSNQKNIIQKVKKKTVVTKNKISQKRSLSVDSTGLFALMNLNTFSTARLHSFMRQSFRQLRKKQIPNLIIDIRNNGGGHISNSTLLTRYLSDHPFKIADSCFALVNHLKPHTSLFRMGWGYGLQYKILSRQSKDNKYHIRHYERKWYYPKRRNHYKGQVYVIISGPTFSASTLFAHALKGQQNVKIIGEEAGGGWYGNNGVLLPTFKLPYTGLRIRMPLYRLVQYRHPTIKGTGLQPDIYVVPDYESIKKGLDKKMKVVLDMISQPTKANH